MNGHRGIEADRRFQEVVCLYEEGAALPCEEQYRSVVESAPDSIYVHNAAGQILDVNETACTVLGYDRQELLAMSICEIEMGVSREVLVDIWARALEGRSLTIEGRERRKDGSTFPVEVRFSPLKQRNQLLLIAFVRDISERKQAEEQLRKSEARFRHLAAIVEASEDSIISLDPELTTITYWNRGAEKMWGWSREEVIGKPFGMSVSPDCQHELQGFKELIRHGVPLEPYERMGTRKDGRRLDVSVCVFPVKDEDGRIISYTAIQRDVTELKKIREQALLDKAELEKTQELNRLKDHFLSTVSHEIKTPLSLITGYLELLENLGQTDEIMTGMKDGTRRLRAHVDNILDYCALASGSLPLYKSEVCPSEIASNVAAMIETDLESKKIDLVVEIDPDLPVILGDTRRITQVYLALLENAAKHTPPGGQIGMRVSSVREQVRVDVWDTGPGIPEDEVPKIWEAFSQLEIGDAYRHGGLGLGLCIVKSLAELHDGRVEIESRSGDGSTFSLFLPNGLPN